MKRATWVMAVLALLLGGIGQGHAGTMYGLSSSAFSPGGQNGGLFTIDETTGQATLVTRISAGTSLVGIDFLHGTLYATDVLQPSGFTFGTINISTGAYTAINNQGGSSNWHGLAANEAADLLYTIDINDGDKLKSVTPSGVITTIGSGTGIDGRGLAYDNAHGILYSTNSGDDSLYTVDTTTGTSTRIGSLGIPAGLIGLEFDSTTGVLYANEASGHNLYRVDPTTGAATLVGPNNVSDTIDSLGFLAQPAVATPEPASLSLLGLGSLGLLGYRWKRKRVAA